MKAKIAKQIKTATTAALGIAAIGLTHTSFAASPIMKGSFAGYHCNQTTPADVGELGQIITWGDLEGYLPAENGLPTTIKVSASAGEACPSVTLEAVLDHESDTLRVTTELAEDDPCAAIANAVVGETREFAYKFLPDQPGGPAFAIKLLPEHASCSAAETSEGPSGLWLAFQDAPVMQGEFAGYFCDAETPADVGALGEILQWGTLKGYEPSELGLPTKLRVTASAGDLCPHIMLEGTLDHEADKLTITTELAEDDPCKLLADSIVSDSREFDYTFLPDQPGGPALAIKLVSEYESCPAENGENGPLWVGFQDTNSNADPVVDDQDSVDGE